MSNAYSIFRTSNGEQLFLETYDQTIKKLWVIETVEMVRGGRKQIGR